MTRLDRVVAASCAADQNNAITHPLVSPQPQTDVRIHVKGITPQPRTTMLKQWMIGATGAALLGAVSVAANAAPASNAAGMRSTHQADSAVEQAADRRCWWRNGVRRCSTYRGRPRVYGYRYYNDFARPEDLPTGSSSWWRSMDREDRGGFGGRR